MGHKVPKLTEYVQQQFADGNVKPAEIKRAFELAYPKAKVKTLQAYCNCLKRMGHTKEVREEQAINVARKKSSIHVLDYPEVNRYEINAGVGRVQASQIAGQKKELVKLWNIMDRSDPKAWTYEDLISAIKEKIPMTEDDRGRMVFSKPGAVMRLLGSFNTMFPGILPKNWSGGLTREAGELKDYLRFDEWTAFIDAIADTEQLSKEGWTALFSCQLNMGCREGTKANNRNQGNGILSFRWESIDYERKRASLHEKGPRGKAGRIWKNLPLDLFPWIHGWDHLMTFHYQRFGYYPTNERHEAGRIFDSIVYHEYLRQFHRVRHACEGRIAGYTCKPCNGTGKINGENGPEECEECEGKGHVDLETMRPHVIRRTHGQWLIKLWVPVEQICGVFPDGFFGVGWDDPSILLKYYVTLEDEQRFRAEKQAVERMQVLNLVVAGPQTVTVQQGLGVKQ